MVGFEVRVNKTSEQKVRRGHGGGDFLQKSGMCWHVI